MERTGIIGAMQVEIEYLCNLIKKEGKNFSEKKSGNLVFYSGEIFNMETVIVKSGVGKVNAALCAQKLILEFGCTKIINTGIAGSLGDGLKIMDFVVSTDAVYHDMDATGFGYKPGQIPQMDIFSFSADKSMIEGIKNAFSRSPFSAESKLVEGRIATGDQFISDKNTKSKIKSIFAPECVEMEGCAIAHACYLNNTPFVILRCMSDMADDTVPSTYEFNESTAAGRSAAIIENYLKFSRTAAL